MRILAKWIFSIMSYILWGILVMAIAGPENPYGKILYFIGGASLSWNICHLIDQIK